MWLSFDSSKCFPIPCRDQLAWIWMAVLQWAILSGVCEHSLCSVFIAIAARSSQLMSTQVWWNEEKHRMRQNLADSVRTCHIMSSRSIFKMIICDDLCAMILFCGLNVVDLTCGSEMIRTKMEQQSSCLQEHVPIHNWCSDGTCGVPAPAAPWYSLIICRLPQTWHGWHTMTYY